MITPSQIDTRPDEIAKYCDACGCSMLHRTFSGRAVNVIAFQFSMGLNAAMNVFSPFKNKEYSICCPCLLKSLGVPIPRENL